MAIWVHAVGRPEIPPLAMPDRFKLDVAYFLTPSGESGVPALPSGECWIRIEDARRWLEDGVIRVVSPLDSQHQTEVELTEEQQAWLEWLVAHDIQHIRLA
jgi:hypothetical protein